MENKVNLSNPAFLFLRWKDLRSLEAVNLSSEVPVCFNSYGLDGDQQSLSFGTPCLQGKYCSPCWRLWCHLRQRSQYCWENTFRMATPPGFQVNNQIFYWHSKIWVQFLDLEPEEVILLWFWSNWALVREKMYSLEQKATAPSHAVPSPSVVLQRLCERLAHCIPGEQCRGKSLLNWNWWQAGFGGKFLIDVSASPGLIHKYFWFQR